MKTYFFYSRVDKSKEPIYFCKSRGRLSAAKQFAEGKQLPLKSFLTIFGVEQSNHAH